ncbi:YTDC2 helicase, partial [Heliornis fulica]|nr:YTDC2 helicase [Heliornis fulica]
QVAGSLMQLRQKWHSLFLRRMQAPTELWSPIDEATLRTITAVLTSEEQAVGLQQPSGIGQKPKPCAFEEPPLQSTCRSTDSRKSSAEAEFSDNSYNAEKVLMKSMSPAVYQPGKHKVENILHSQQTSDDKSGRSSVKSTESSS